MCLVLECAETDFFLWLSHMTNPEFFSPIYTQHQSQEWHTFTFPCPSKPRMNTLKIKTMCICFFNSQEAHCQSAVLQWGSLDTEKKLFEQDQALLKVWCFITTMHLVTQHTLMHFWMNPTNLPLWLCSPKLKVTSTDGFWYCGHQIRKLWWTN